jgi:hypothetical protein
MGGAGGRAGEGRRGHGPELSTKTKISISRAKLEVILHVPTAYKIFDF